MNHKILIILMVFIIPALLLGQINWTKRTIDDNFDGPVCVNAADIDGDNDLDVVGAADMTDEIVWWENVDAIGTTWIEHTIDDNFDRVLSIYAADIDGDDDIDIVGASYMAHDIAWWENADDTGYTWVRHDVDLNFIATAAVYSADVDGDGDLDILGAATIGDEIAWWENVDTIGTVWSKHSVDSTYDNARAVCAEDIDGDGDIDILGAATNDDDVTWWENADTSGTTWMEHTIDDGLDGAFTVYAADIDGDEDIDVIAAACIEDGVYWWENADDTGETWIPHTVDANFDYVWQVYAADIDDDDDLDILGAASGSDEIAWWENADTSGTTWIEHVIDSTLTTPRYVYAADIDGDGDIDVIGTDNALDDVYWYESNLLDIHDVAPVSIDIPSQISEDTSLNPQATVKNMGSRTETFPVRCTIEPGGYTKTQTINDLASGDSVQVTFTTQFTFESGLYTVTVFTMLGSDEIPANDTLEKVIEATGIAEQGSAVPESFRLSVSTISTRNATIELAIPVTTKIELVVYDAAGRLSQTITNRTLSAGVHTINAQLNLVPGVYFYSMKTLSGENIIKKFLIVE
jgi:hypothetical protein